MKSLLSNAKLGEDITNNAFGNRAPVKLGDSAYSHFYIRGCSISGKPERVGFDCRVYKFASAKQRCMLASRGYNCILPARYFLVGKESLDNFRELL